MPTYLWTFIQISSTISDMVTIEIGNSTSQIKGLASTPFNILRKALSYSVDAQAAYFSNNHFNTIRYCIDKYGTFSTGLLIYVKMSLDSQNIHYRVSDIRFRPASITGHLSDFSMINPHEWQLEAVNAVERKHRGIISAPTGTGKSLVIALIVAKLHARTLVVVPSLQIKEQLTESLQRVFKDMSNITVENIDSSALKTANNYDCLIIDEAHHVAAKTYQKLNKTAWKNIYYRVFLTATPFRNATEETMLFEGIAGQVIYELSYTKAIKAKYIVPVEAYYIEVPKQKTEAFTWAQVYSELITNNENKNQIIAKVLLNLGISGTSTLCLVKEIKHGNLLAELTGLPFANGQDASTRHHIEQFNKGSIKALIGTEGILGEGLDTKACEYVIIAGLGKAKSAFMQKVGRAVRTYSGKDSAKIIIIKDKSHKFLSRHFKAQCDILKSEYGVVPIKLEV